MTKPVTLHFGNYTILHYHFGPKVLTGDIEITAAVNDNVNFYGSAVDPDWDVLGSLTDNSSGGVTTNNARWRGFSPGIFIGGSGTFVENADGNYIEVSSGANVNITITGNGSNVKIDVKVGGKVDTLTVENGANGIVIVNDGTIEDVIVEEGASDVIINSDGPIELVTVDGKNVNLTVYTGQVINNLVVTGSSEDVSITIVNGATVGTLIIKSGAKNILITNGGTLTTLKVEDDSTNVSITNNGTVAVLENHSSSTVHSGNTPTPATSVGSSPARPNVTLGVGGAGETKIIGLGACDKKNILKSR